jgi:hypothetical protein
MQFFIRILACWGWLPLRELFPETDLGVFNEGALGVFSSDAFASVTDEGIFKEPLHAHVASTRSLGVFRVVPHRDQGL